MKTSLISSAVILCCSPFIGANAETNAHQDIEQITITANRSASSLKSVDTNLSVLNQDNIELVEQQHINQLIARVPGGWISRGNGQEHLSAIRSPVLTGAGGCGAFYMAQDGISTRASGFCNANQLFDLNTEQAHSIEVLRGPASTLYGSNAVHGVINVLTPNPIDDIKRYIGVSVGPHEYYQGRFSVGSSGEKQAFVVYGNLTDDGGYKDDSGYEQQKINVIHQYQHDGLSIKSVIAASHLDQETAGFIKGFEAYKEDELKQQNPNPEAYRDSESFRAYSQIDYVIDNERSLRFSPYVRKTKMEFLQHFLPWQALEKNEQQGIGFQSQYQIISQDISWLFGLDVDLTEGKLYETQTEEFSPTIPQGEHYDYTVDARVYSPFIKLNWQASDDLSLSAGLRYDDTEFDYNNYLTDGSACAQGVNNCRFIRPQDQRVAYQEFSYQLGLSYALADNHRFYSQYSLGYRAPQATELFRLQAGQMVADLDAEQLTSIELGLRGQWQQLYYDISVFSMHKDNFIFQDTNRQNISNGETSHNGIEFTLSYYFADDFYLKASGTLANHKYDNALAISQVNIKGNEIDTAPQHMGNAQLGWRSSNKTLIEAEWQHLGNYYLNPENTAEYSGHNLVNLRAQYALSDKIQLSVQLLNVLDKDYAERADFGFGSYRYFVGEPRSVFASIKYQLD